jgi:Polyketide cyclase / dehydrase and lipid transport
MKPRYGAWIAVMAGASAAGFLLARRWQLRWGATAQELAGPLPGDELIAPPDLAATRALTIRAPAERVWPWIAQLGQARGGFYSYDFLENLVGCNIHSADRVVPEWQAIKAGDEVRLHPDVALEVAAVDPGRSLVLRGGVPAGDAPPPFDFTWAFALQPGPDGTTRLIVRERYAYTRPWARFMVEPVEVIDFVMTQKMLRGIRSRAEQAA